MHASFWTAAAKSYPVLTAWKVQAGYLAFKVHSLFQYVSGKPAAFNSASHCDLASAVITTGVVVTTLP